MRFGLPDAIASRFAHMNFTRVDVVAVQPAITSSFTV